MYFLTTRPLWVLGLLALLLTALAMCGPFLVRRYVTLERLTTNNEVAGFKFATLGVLYAVLLAFAVILVWERFNDAEHAVAAEAGSAATLYRLALSMGEGLTRMPRGYEHLASSPVASTLKLRHLVVSRPIAGSGRKDRASTA